jgi:hypothetical protein
VKLDDEEEDLLDLVGQGWEEEEEEEEEQDGKDFIEEIGEEKAADLPGAKQFMNGGSIPFLDCEAAEDKLGHSRDALLTMSECNNREPAQVLSPHAVRARNAATLSLCRNYYTDVVKRQQDELERLIDERSE